MLKQFVGRIAVMLKGSRAVEPFEDADDAYLRGDHAEAVKLIRSLAAQGNADAQLNLGTMYANGQGMAQDDAEAVK